MRKIRKEIAALGCVACTIFAGGMIFNGMHSDAGNMQVKVGDLTVEIPDDALAANVTSFLNIRYEPSSSSAVIGEMKPGDLVTYVGENGDWTEIDVNGQRGYVFTKYTVKGGALKKYVKNHIDEFEVSATQTDKAFQALYKKKKDARVDVKTVSMGGIVTKTGTLYASKSTAKTLKNQYETVERAVVDVDALRMRQRASKKGKISTVLTKGTDLNIVSDKNPKWLKVEHDGTTGYVSADYIKTVMVNVNKSNIIKNMKKGQNLKVLDVTKKWVKVINDGGVAYMQREYCQIKAKLDKTDSSVAGWMENNTTCQVQHVGEELALVSLEDGSQGYVATSNLKATISVDGVEIDEAAVKKEEQKVTAQLQQNSVVAGDNSAPVSATRKEVVEYAKSFVGGKYVWGGNSLTEGVDCSGFTQQVFLHYGISLHRCSYEQVKDGKEISFEELRPGDLVFYYKEKLGRIGHVAMYIGDGQVVHAQSKATGICITRWDYGTPYKAVSILGD